MPPPGDAPATSIHMIAFERHIDAVRFLCEMQDVAYGLHQDADLRRSVVATVAEFKAALRTPAELVIISAHGQAYERGIPFVPGIGDMPEGTNWLRLRDFACGTDAKVGARAGIFWDVCNAGRPKFREELQPLLKHQVAHIGVIGAIYYDDSVKIGTEILTALLPSGSPITAEAVAAAAERATTVTSRQLRWMWLGGEEAT